MLVEVIKYGPGFAVVCGDYTKVFTYAHEAYTHAMEVRRFLEQRAVNKRG